MLMHPFFFLFYFHWVIGTLVTVIMKSKLATLTPSQVQTSLCNNDLFTYLWQVISLLSENATYSKADQKGDSGKGNHKYNAEC